MSYETFSQFYDTVMDQDAYESWMKYFQQHEPLFPERASVMELACGTGKIAVRLAKAGYDVVGVDLSSDMLALAYQRAEEANVTVQWMEADMRELAVIGEFDCITCFSDSLCYMRTKEEVKKVFEGVYQNLKEEGVFLFDVHSLYQMNEVFPGYQYIYQDDQNAFLWESFALEENAVEHVLTFFLENESGMYERIEEVHEEKTFSVEEYKALLLQVGFKNVTVSASFGEEEVTDSSPRWFFSCLK